MKKPWIQAAIDVEDIELAKKIAFMALDNGAEWLEVGTPLLYTYGHEAIGMIRKAVGRNAVLVADYKAPFAALCAEQAAKQGVDYVMLSTSLDEWLIDLSLKTCQEFGVEPIFDLSVKQADIPLCIDVLVNNGAKYIFSRHFKLSKTETGELTKSDNMPFLTKTNKTFNLGITSDDLDEAVDSVRLGADWITFGYVLRNPDPVVCKKWIDTIHNAR